MTSYKINIGSFKCAAISDGLFKYKPPMFPDPGKLLFTNAPKESLDLTLREHHIAPEKWTEWVSPYTCMTIDTGEHQVLVDTGAGDLDINTGKLLQNLKEEGVAPKDFDTVILTHAHPDHVGGNVLTDGNPAFPTARFVIWRDEWNFWTSQKSSPESEDNEHLNMLRGLALKNLLPIRSQLVPIDREKEIVPGISTISAPGHTPGHMALVVASGDERLFIVADAVLHPIHLERSDWYSAVDFYPGQAVLSRRRLLNTASEENALMSAFHFPFPGIGRVVENNETWLWQPLA
jgi:glyoxylase-like metal-dependent hydrolase (beta-lactamase superfamily II)